MRGRQSGVVRLIGLVALVSAVAGGCAPSDQGGATFSASRSGDGERDGRAEVRPLDTPDLTRLSEPVRNQLRERYAALTRLDHPETPADELGRAYGDLGLMLMAADYETAALSTLLNAQAVAPRDARWPYYLAQFHLIRGDHARATEFFERALELRPTDLVTLVHLGGMYVDQDRADEAQRLFEAALDHQPGSASALAGLGRAALARGDHARAAEHLTRALNLEPQATSLHYPLALAYRSLGEPDKTDTHLQRLGNGTPTLSDPLMEAFHDLLESGLAYQNRGLAAMQTGAWDEAARLFRKGLELEPENPALRHPLATVLYQMGDVDAAVEQFEEIIRQSAAFAQAPYSLGLILESQGRYEEAVTRFSTAVRIDPNYVEARLGLARSLFALRQMEAALPHYLRIVEVDPRRVEAWIEGADVLVSLERYEEARDWLIDARKIHGQQPDLVVLYKLVEALLTSR